MHRRGDNKDPLFYRRRLLPYGHRPELLGRRLSKHSLQHTFHKRSAKRRARWEAYQRRRARFSEWRRFRFPSGMSRILSTMNGGFLHLWKRYFFETVTLPIPKICPCQEQSFCRFLLPAEIGHGFAKSPGIGHKFMGADSCLSATQRVVCRYFAADFGTFEK